MHLSSCEKLNLTQGYHGDMVESMPHCLEFTSQPFSIQVVDGLGVGGEN